MTRHSIAALAAAALCASSPAAAEDLIEQADRARQAYDQGRMEEALQRYRLLEEKVPGNGEIRFRLGNVFARLGRLDESAKTYQELLARERHPKAWHNLGIVRIRQAMAALTQAAEMEGAAPEAASRRLLGALETALAGPVQTQACPPAPEPAPPPAAVPEPLEAFTTTRVHLRQGRGAGHARLDTLSADVPVAVLARQDGYGRVRTAEGAEGWLPLYLLRLGAAPSARNGR
jgi:tetratricopeptide (TPR) repeat protein